MYGGLKKIIEESNRVVFFGGAGVSTESGIPDFRSSDGLYNALRSYNHVPEELLSHNFFEKNAEIFYDYYKKNLIYKDAQPNKAHKALARLEKEGKIKAVITQNVDGLHQMAGSKNVLELHGSIHRNYCMQCGRKFDLDFIMQSEGVPLCPVCKGVVRPDIVLYEEPLNEEVINKSIQAVRDSDALIVGGTSLVVYPAAGLINYFNGKYLVLINKTETNYDDKADLVIHAPIGEVLGEVVKLTTEN
ncbi:MAG: NAD-dependent protein deacylase [Clostridiales bacterium]|nr:NAD-dependent protein deacylase [Clostridiales bacterium]